jgi:RNA polymerase sigma-70 factor (ECF subfamily)
VKRGQRWTPAAPSNGQTVEIRLEPEVTVRLDVDAFEQLYREHAPRVYALAWRMSGSPWEAEDLLQEIFIHAFQKRDSFRGEASIGTWLHRLAINYCLDYMRSRRAKMTRLTSTIDAEGSIEPAARPDASNARLDLQRAIAKLPDGCREAFVLHDVEGFSHEEIARLLGVAEGTSKSKVFRARLKLRELLK